MGSSQSDDCDTRDSQPVEDTILTNLTNKSFREEQNAKGPQNKAKSRLGIRAEANGLNHGTLSTLAGPSTASLEDIPPVEVMRASTRSSSRRAANNRQALQQGST